MMISFSISTAQTEKKFMETSDEFVRTFFSGKYIPVIPWGQGGRHVCWRLLFLLYNVFITDRTEAVCTIVWIETAPIAAQHRMLFHVVWFLIHFVLWFFPSCFFSCFQVSQMTFSDDFTSLSANENKFWH